jgi:predicted DNA-binding protein (MmcQ/YjbR family)
MAKAAAKKKTAAKKTAAKKTTAAKGGSALAIVRALRAHAMAYPGAVEEFPWDHSVVKVGKKVLVFLTQDKFVKDTIEFSVKLPESSAMALSLPGAQPTGYGLGKAGWVSFTFTASDAPPLSVMTAWLDESFCAVGPKRSIAQWRESQGATRKGGAAR